MLRRQIILLRHVGLPAGRGAPCSARGGRGAWRNATRGGRREAVDAQGGMRGGTRQRTAAMSSRSAGCSLFARVVKTICGIRKGVSKPCTLPSNPCDPRAPCPP